MQPTATITLEQVPTLKINQKVNVTAMISLGSEQPKPVEVKSTQKDDIRQRGFCVRR